MPKLSTLGKDNPNRDLPNQLIKGNGPSSMKPWILIGLAVAAYFTWNSKTL